MDDRLRWPGCALALSHAPKRGVPFEGVEEGQKGRVNKVRDQSSCSGTVSYLYQFAVVGEKGKGGRGERVKCGMTIRILLRWSDRAFEPCRGALIL